ncbi:hypothetical protein JXJ21_05700 [candidate division KSB1 bacterium]|nr:hypothetical protein [candidate division KSB1 bacterium]
MNEPFDPPGYRFLGVKLTKFMPGGSSGSLFQSVDFKISLFFPIGIGESKKKTKAKELSFFFLLMQKQVVQSEEIIFWSLSSLRVFLYKIAICKKNGSLPLRMAQDWFRMFF